MADPTAMLQEFVKVVEQIELKGRKPSEEDINEFLGNFFDPNKRAFQYGTQYVYTASRVGPNGEPLYDKTGKSYQELLDEAKPVLMQRVTEAYSEVSDFIGPWDWPTAPMSIDEAALLFAKEMKQEDDYLSIKGADRRNHKAYQKAISHIGRIKYRIKQYMKTVMPFTARTTMYHPLAGILYFTNNGGSELVQGLTIDSEEKLLDFTTGKSISKFPGADHDGLRSIWWVPSTSGKGVKMGVVDIDNPEDTVSEKDMLTATRKIEKRLSDLGHPTIIMFTGSTYQVWFGQNDREPLENYREMNDYLQGILFQFGAFDREESIELGVPYLDLKTNKPGGLLRTFFSLHYPAKTGARKKYTGLAAVPVAPEDLKNFNPAKYAHPETVLANFEVYSNYVAAFYDRVQVGQDYEAPGDTETTPTCSRLEKKYPTHKLLKKYLHPDTDINKIDYRNAGASLEDEKKVTVHAIARGVLAVLVYDPSGTVAPKGMTRQRLVKDRTGKARAVTETPHAFYITSTGLVVYDDYICRDLERLCVSKKIRDAVLVGRISSIDTFGSEEGEASTRFKLIAKEGIRPTDSRVMRFTINRVPIVGSKVVPMEVMGEQVKEFSTKRIVPTEYFIFDAPVGQKVKHMFSSFIADKRSGAMMIYGEQKYLLTSTRTLRATIVGIQLSSAYNRGEIPTSWIALAKPSQKYGLIYYIVGKAQVALKQADRVKLLEMVEGEEKRNLIPMPRNYEDYQDIASFAEPTAVVEITYDDVSPYKQRTLGFAFIGGKFRPIPPPLTINALINAKITGILEGFSVKRSVDINIRQEPLIEIDKKLDSSGSLLAVLPNPNEKLPTFIRRNPAFFGAPAELETYATWTGYVPRAKKVTYPGNFEVLEPQGYGGRKIQVPLLEVTAKTPRVDGQRIEPELKAASKRLLTGEPGFAAYIEPKSLQKAPSPAHYRQTNLGFEYNTAVDDPYGSGQDGNMVTSFNGQVKEIRNFSDVMELAHLINEGQAIEDSKLYSTTFREVPGDAGSEVANYRNFDVDYQQAYTLYGKSLKAAITPQKISKDSAIMLVDDVLGNPRPVQEDALHSRLVDFTEDFNKWSALPEPKETWENYALGKYLSWEVPILEKERVVAEARSANELTEEEVDSIDLNYSTPDEGNPFESLLTKLYEVNDIDDNTEAVFF